MTRDRAHRRSVVARTWRGWVGFWSRREDATGLAVFRILVSWVVVYSLLSAAHAGVVDVVWLGEQHGGLVARESPHWLWAFLDSPGSSDGTTSQNIWVLWWLALAFALCSGAGLGGRWPLLLSQQTYHALVSVNPHSSGGYDDLIRIALLVLFASSCTATLSVDCWRRRRRWSAKVLVPAWPRYVLVIQLMLMYTMTGLQKSHISWTPLGGYSALHYVLHDPTWTRFSSEWIEALSPVWRVMTAVTWHWEQLSWLMLLVLYYRLTPERPGRLRRWLNRWDLRVPWAVVGLLVHGGILLLMDVGPFSWITLSFYVHLWSGCELRRAFTRLSALRRPKTASS